jgi:hypothetical protein
VTSLDRIPETTEAGQPRRRSRMARLAVGAATAALATAGAVAVLPGIAQAAPPALTVTSATCNATGWHVHWRVNNNSPLVMTIGSETVTGAVTDGLTFTPNPVPGNTLTNAPLDFAAGTTGSITAHVSYHYGANPNVDLTKTWAIGDTEGGSVTVTDDCPAPVELHVAPTSTVPGTGVHVTGRCEPNSSGVVYSNIFVDSPPDHDFANLGASPFTTDAAGNFATWATVDPRSAPGTYHVEARCGGANIGITADLTIVAPAVTPTLDPTTPTPSVVDTPVRAVPVFTG